MDRDGEQRGRLLRVLVALWLVVIIWAIFPYTREPTGAIKEAVLRVGAAALYLVYLAASWGKLRPGQSTGAWTVSAFSAWTLFTVVGAANVGQAVYSASALVALAGVYAVARWAYRSADQVWATVGIVAAALVVSSAYGFAQFFGWDPMPWDAGIAEAYGVLQQGPSTFGNANYASHALVLAVVLTAGWAIARGRWIARGGWIATVPLVVFGLHFVLTRTRGSMVALGVASLFVAVTWVLGRLRTNGHGRTRTDTDRATAAAIGVVALALIAMGVGVAGVTYARNASPLPYDPTVAIRVQTLSGATAMVRERPVLGFGAGGYALSNPQFWTDDEQRRFAETGAYNENVHGDVLEVAVNTGFVGAALFMAVIAFALVGAMRLTATERRRECVLGWCGAAFVVAFFVDGWFGFPLHTPVASALFFVLIGAISGVGRGSSPVGLGFRVGAVVAGVVLIAGAAMGVTHFLSELYSQQGRAARAAGQLRSADAAYAAASRFAPYHWRVPYERAAVAMSMGNTSEAAMLYERAVALNPGNVYARLGAARAHVLLAQEEQFAPRVIAALRRADEALAMNGYLADAYDVRGRALTLQAQWSDLVEDWREAESSLLKATTLPGGDQASTWRLIAEARIRQGNELGAVGAVVAALKAAPADDRSWDRLEKLAADTGTYRALAQAIDWRLSALRDEGHFTGSETAKLYVRLASVLERSGAPSEALANAFGDAVASDRTRPETWEALLDWAIESNALDFFTNRLRGVARDYASRNAALPFALQPAALVAMDEFDAAVDALENALTREWPQWELPRVKVGLRVSGAYLAALAVEHDGAADALLVAGRALIVGDDPEAAIAVYRRAEDAFSGANAVDALLGQAVALTLLERPDEAVVVLERAARLDMRRLDARLALAGAYFDAERWAEARLEYEALLGSLAQGDPLRATIEAQLGRIPE